MYTPINTYSFPHQYDSEFYRPVKKFCNKYNGVLKGFCRHSYIRRNKFKLDNQVDSAQRTKSLKHAKIYFEVDNSSERNRTIPLKDRFIANKSLDTKYLLSCNEPENAQFIPIKSAKLCPEHEKELKELAKQSNKKLNVDNQSKLLENKISNNLQKLKNKNNEYKKIKNENIPKDKRSNDIKSYNYINNSNNNKSFNKSNIYKSNTVNKLINQTQNQDIIKKANLTINHINYPYQCNSYQLNNKIVENKQISNRSGQQEKLPVTETRRVYRQILRQSEDNKKLFFIKLKNKKNKEDQLSKKMNELDTVLSKLLQSFKASAYNLSKEKLENLENELIELKLNAKNPIDKERIEDLDKKLMKLKSAYNFYKSPSSFNNFSNQFSQDNKTTRYRTSKDINREKEISKYLKFTPKIKEEDNWKYVVKEIEFTGEDSDVFVRLFNPDTRYTGVRTAIRTSISHSSNKKNYYKT